MIRSASRSLMRSMKLSSVSSLSNSAAWALATSRPSLSPSSTSPTPTYQALLSARHVQRAWADPWCLEHLAVEQVLNQRDVVQRELADEEDIEAAALCDGLEDARDPTKVTEPPL
jgi:hypothetical protein